MKTVYICSCSVDCGGVVIEHDGQLYFQDNTMDALVLIENMNNGYINGKWNLLPNGIEIVEKAFRRLQRAPKNQIIEIDLQVNCNYGDDQLVYTLQFHRKDGSRRRYQTTHRSSKALDWLSDCVSDPKWLESYYAQLSIYPTMTYRFKDRTCE